jgi:uncharacterized membrane protein
MTDFSTISLHYYYVELVLTVYYRWTSRVFRGTGVVVDVSVPHLLDGMNSTTVVQRSMYIWYEPSYVTKQYRTEQKIFVRSS